MLEKKFLIILALIFFTTCLTQAVNAENRHQNTPGNMEGLFLSMNWEVGSEEADNFIGKVSDEQIIDLFIEIEKRDEKEKSDLLGSSWEELKEIQGPETVADHDVKDLNNDGQYEVLIPTGISAVVHYLSVICKIGDSIKVKHFDKPYHLEDVNGDDIEELLIHTFLAYKTWTIGEGTVIWPDIYEWDGSEFNLVNDKFPEYYEEKISEYNENIEKLRTEFDPYQRAQETGRSVEYWQERMEMEIKASQKGIRNAELVLAIPATIDIDPDTLNLKGKGKWITCYIELPSDYNVVDINISTILLNDTLSSETSPTEIGDYDNDGIYDLMVKFDREKLIRLLEVGEVSLMVTGKLMNEKEFKGSDIIKVISGKPRKD